MKGMELVDCGGIVSCLVCVRVCLAVLCCVRDTVGELTAKAASVVVFCCCPSTVNALGFGYMGGWAPWWNCGRWWHIGLW